MLLPGLLLPAPAAVAAPLACTQADADLPPPLPPVQDQRLEITADQGVLKQDGVSDLSGGVRLRQGDREFSASALSYDDSEQQVRINQESVFRNRDLVIRSREAQFDIDAGSGTFGQTEFTVTGRAARGTADTITLNKEGLVQVDGATYTTCAPDTRGWMLKASEIELDHVEGLGSASNARLSFGGVPFLWMPYFQFPIDDRRRTGLLFPTIGDGNKTGFDIRAPVYLNLAPNYDATVTPRWMSSRGVQLGGDSRYLITDGIGSLHVEYLDEDRQTNSRRSYYQADMAGLASDRLGYGVHVGATSDPTYFEDFGGLGDLASSTHLERTAFFTYQAPAAYSITAATHSYQTLAGNLAPADQPYERLPQILVNARTKNSRFDTRLGFQGEYVNFARAGSVQGERIDLAPSLRMERDRIAWYTALQADYRYTAYRLTGVTAGADDRPTRELPQASAEGGLRFERITSGGRLQTLEPYVFYLYTPFREQNHLPLFDTGQPDFDYTQLFARNRFSGEDRISDANQFALAARSRLLDAASGEVVLSASVGQLFRLHESRVQVPGISAPDSGATDFFADLNYRLSSRWSSQLASDWSPNDRRFNRIGFALRYRNRDVRADLAYRYRRDLLEQADVAASFPLGGSWRLAGRSRYSLRDSQPLDNLAGFEYETCCYAVRTSYRRYIATTAGEYNSGIYLQLELKGLTRIGAGFDGLLPLDETADGRNAP